MKEVWTGADHRSMGRVRPLRHDIGTAVPVYMYLARVSWTNRDKYRSPWALTWIDGTYMLFLHSPVQLHHINSPSTRCCDRTRLARSATVQTSPGAAGPAIVGSDPAILHESLWFNDRSIVLSVERTLFRVHHSDLCTVRNPCRHVKHSSA